jgi:chromate reductase
MSTQPITRILALSGSLRSDSLNTALLRAAAESLPPGAALEVYDYRDVPLYDGDIDGVPEPVERLRAAISRADAVLLAVPEYNYSLPGVLKNAIDWASRPAYRSPFRDKPVGVVSAAASFVGGARGQQHTKTILLGMAAPVFPWPELLVGGAHAKFTDGALTDGTTARLLDEYVQGFVRWVRAYPRAAHA